MLGRFAADRSGEGENAQTPVPQRNAGSSGARREYQCADGAKVSISHHSLNSGQDGANKPRSRSVLMFRKAWRNAPPLTLVLISDCIFDRTLTSFLRCGRTTKTLTLPETAENALNDAFANATDLRTVTLNEQLNRLDEKTFGRCQNLKVLRVSGGNSPNL